MGSVNKTVSNRSSREVQEYQFKPFVLKQHYPNTPEELNPKGRSGHRIVSDDTFLYSFGGFNPNLEDDDRNNDTGLDMKLFKELWRFNYATGEWRKMVEYGETMPKELASNALLLNGNMLIVHGGTGVPFGFTCSNKTYICNLKRDKSLKMLKTGGSRPTPQYGQSMVIVGHKLYVIGGTSGFEYSSDIHCLNLKTNIWEATYICKGKDAMEPKGRYRHEIAFYNSRIIVFGGGTVDQAFGFKKLPAFNLETNEWEILMALPDPNMSGNGESTGYPLPRRCHGSVQVPEDENQDPEFIICGGYDGKDIFSDIWKINLRTLQWTCFTEELKYPLYFHATSLNPCGQMFIFGGICQIFNEDVDVDSDNITYRTNDIYSIWVKVPKLSEMCWDALLFYNPNLSKYPKSKLLKSGIPSDFVNRIS